MPLRHFHYAFSFAMKILFSLIPLFHDSWLPFRFSFSPYADAIIAAIFIFSWLFISDSAADIFAALRRHFSPIFSHYCHYFIAIITPPLH